MKFYLLFTKQVNTWLKNNHTTHPAGLRREKEGKMPKDRFSLSKKHEYLIDKITEIPTIYDIKNAAWSNDALCGKCTDFRYNTEDILLMIIESLTKGTQREEIGKEISKKARAVFDYYTDK